MKILIYDHAGHPFQVQLSRSLASRGHVVLHAYCGLLQTPRGTLAKKESDSNTFSIKPINLSEPFSRYSMAKRVLQEKQLGALVSREIQNFKPDTVISANTPLGAQKAIMRTCENSNSQFIYWVQDLLGIGIRNNLAKKLPVLGKLVGTFYVRLDHFLLRKSDQVVLITNDFRPVMERAGVLRSKTHVIHNWAPLDEVPVLEKNNGWSRANGLDKTFNFVYSGTLGMKHNPGLLVELGRSLASVSDTRLVVISEGLGAEYLAEKKKTIGLEDLMLLPFQPFDQVPHVQAAADVLVAILEPDAGVFAVPSKVLTYMCARRPLLLAVPPENLAARIVKDTGAGVVVDPADTQGFVKGANKLMKDRKLREIMGQRGRKYAETYFNINTITDKFEEILSVLEAR